MSSSLPNRPSYVHLRHQARDLQQAFAAGEASAHGRVREQLGEVGPMFRLAQAQCVIAREYGFRSWRKLKEAVVSQEPVDETEDPLHVWYAGRLLVGAAITGMLKFSVCRHDGLLSVESWGRAVSLEEFAQCCLDGDSSGNEQKPAPVDQVWERLLVMAELTNPQATKGVIRMSLTDRYPYTHWIIAVSRPDPDRLDFVLDLNEVETIPPSGRQETTGQRMAALVRGGADEPLSPEKEAALEQIVSYYDRALYHRMVIREIAELLPKATHNLDAIALCAKLVGSFGYHTGSLVDIARIAAGCDRPCPDLPQLAELVVRHLSGTLDMVRLASGLVAAQSDAERAPLKAEIAQLDVTADFATVKEAYDWQPT